MLIQDGDHFCLIQVPVLYEDNPMATFNFADGREFKTPVTAQIRKWLNYRHDRYLIIRVRGQRIVSTAPCGMQAYREKREEYERARREDESATAGEGPQAGLSDMD